jgi:hypothetical protein
MTTSFPTIASYYRRQDIWACDLLSNVDRIGNADCNVSRPELIDHLVIPERPYNVQVPYTWSTEGMNSFLTPSNFGDAVLEVLPATMFLDI